MATGVGAAQGRVTIEVSEDRLQAYCLDRDPGNPRMPSLQEVTEALDLCGVVVDETVRERINTSLSLPPQTDERAMRLLVAQGRPPIEGSDGEFQWHESLRKIHQDWEGNAPVDYYTFNSLTTVEKGQPMGTVVPATPGTDGVDVFGCVISPRRRGTDVQLDDTVRRGDEDPTMVFAGIAGKVTYQDRTLRISEVFSVEGDVDFETGHIDSCVDVAIGGTIRNRFRVKSKGSVSVGGAVEAAGIEAGRDVVVRGGILQRGSGCVRAGGDIVTRFCDEADLHAKGDVKIARELINSRVHCHGKLLAARGAVVGGRIYAREGVEIATVGNRAGAATEIIVGVDPDVVRETEHVLEQLEPKRLSLERIRQLARPFLAEVKRLTPAQRERATELLCRADQAEAEITEVERDCAARLERTRATGVPYVLVSSAVHPHASIRIGHRATEFQKTLQGAVRIEKRKVHRATEFVAVDQSSGSVRVLQSAAVVDRRRARHGDQG